MFFSSIAVILGIQALLAGAVLAHYSSLTVSGTSRRFEFVGRPSFMNACFAGGVLAVLGGLLIDLGLFFVWVNGDSSPANRSINGDRSRRV